MGKKKSALAQLWARALPTTPPGATIVFVIGLVTLLLSLLVVRVRAAEMEVSSQLHLRPAITGGNYLRASPVPWP